MRDITLKIYKYSEKKPPNGLEYIYIVEEHPIFNYLTFTLVRVVFKECYATKEPRYVRNISSESKNVTQSFFFDDTLWAPCD